jgi:hypothetical protein
MARHELNVAQELGDAIAKVCEKKKVTVIASTDFSHYITQKQAEAMDSGALQKIEALDIFGFNQYLTAKKPSICGKGPIISAMSYAQSRHAQTGHLLKYATSGDTTKDLTKVVGYGSVIFE